MKKIIFEDTTVVKQPYVEINGVEHEVHDGEYQGGTDLDAETFNTMQNNIAGYIDGEESMGSITVEDIECKNMINKNTFTLSYTYGSDGVWTFNGKNAISDYIEIENNKPYTISSITSPTAIVVHYFNSSKQWQERAVYQNVNEIHITNTNNYPYIRISFNYDDTTTVTQSIIDSMQFQVEEGDIHTDYVEHKDYGIQSGTNSNGSWIKYEDGTLIQTGTVEVPANIGNTTATLPIEFVDNKYRVSITNIYYSGIAFFWSIGVKTTTTVKLYVRNMSNNVPSSITQSDYVAIGRWK